MVHIKKIFKKDLNCVCVCVSHLVVSDSATPWAVACQVPLSMEFSRQDTGVGCHSLLQGSSWTSRISEIPLQIYSSCKKKKKKKIGTLMNCW